MMIIKPILALSCAVLALAAPPQSRQDDSEPPPGTIDVDLAGGDLLDIGGI